ncbi:MAG: aconitate hydratase AcnA [Gammaproteobacteria bacterium]|nr:aconitate hydratase AcnA [Gammaproteobacteria bacterium]
MPLKVAHESWKQLSNKKTATCESGTLEDGSVVLAAITSCTNTSNPHVLITAGLLAEAALEHGLQRAPWVKTSLAPGSQTVTTYLQEAGLLESLEKLGFYVVGYGCTTCIGNSGPLDADIASAITTNNLNVCSVLSGNRNFEGRIHPLITSNYLASPPLVVAYALTGRMDIDWANEPLGISSKTQKPIYLKDLWPGPEKIEALVQKVLSQKLYSDVYKKVFEGDDRWKSVVTHKGTQYQWDKQSTYLKRPPYLTDCPKDPAIQSDLKNARVLAVFGHSITTDHISPAGTILMDSPAGHYLREHGVSPELFNSYGSRRGHDEIMIRGTFANSRLKNLCVAPKLGGWTIHWPTQEVCTIFDASLRYAQEKTPLVIVAGKEYGSGSSRDWAAKGPALLGVKAILAESYERIHRSNLIGMGIVPLQFINSQTAESLQITGQESFNIDWDLSVGGIQSIEMIRTSGESVRFDMKLRIDTSEELAYLNHGGILPYVLRKMNPSVE